MDIWEYNNFGHYLTCLGHFRCFPIKERHIHLKTYLNIGRWRWQYTNLFHKLPYLTAVDSSWIPSIKVMNRLSVYTHTRIRSTPVDEVEYFYSRAAVRMTASAIKLLFSVTTINVFLEFHIFFPSFFSSIQLIIVEKKSTWEVTPHLCEKEWNLLKTS